MNTLNVYSTACILQCYVVFLLDDVFNPDNLISSGQWPQYEPDDTL